MRNKIKSLWNKIRVWLIHKLGGDCYPYTKKIPMVIEHIELPTVKYRATQRISSYDKSLYGERYMKEQLAIDMARNILSEMEIFVDDNYETNITTYEAEIEIVRRGARR